MTSDNMSKVKENLSFLKDKFLLFITNKNNVKE